MGKVVTVEIVTNCVNEAEAERVVLDILERESRVTDALYLGGWQVTGIAGHYSEQAKAYSPA